MAYHSYLSLVVSRLDKYLTSGRIRNRLKNDTHTFTSIVSELDKESRPIIVLFFLKTVERIDGVNYPFINRSGHSKRAIAHLCSNLLRMHNYVNISYGSFFRAASSSSPSVRSWSSLGPLPAGTVDSNNYASKNKRTNRGTHRRARRFFQSIRRSTDCYRLSGVRHFVRSAGPVPINVRPRARTGQKLLSLPLPASLVGLLVRPIVHDCRGRDGDP